MGKRKTESCKNWQFGIELTVGGKKSSKCLGEKVENKLATLLPSICPKTSQKLTASEIDLCKKQFHFFDGKTKL